MRPAAGTPAPTPPHTPTHPAPPPLPPSAGRQLFLGDTARAVAETPLNQASSRSHCLFTLHIEARRAGEELVRRSKLNFVDLAGSGEGVGHVWRGWGGGRAGTGLGALATRVLHDARVAASSQHTRGAARPFTERAAKTGLGGTLLSEAKHINLSLHFLEQVSV